MYVCMYVCMYVAYAYRIVSYRIVMVTRMLAINVPIPNLTVARLEQFRTLKANHPLYEIPMSLSSVRGHLQVVLSQNWLPRQRPLDPRSRIGQLDPGNLPPTINTDSLAVIQPKLYRFES